MRTLERTWGSTVFLVVGVALLGFVYYGIYTPTVTAPNYWENNTSGLLPFLGGTVLAGGFIAGGVFLGIDRLTSKAVDRLGARHIRVTGLCCFLGGLLLLLVSHPTSRRLINGTIVGRVLLQGAAVLLVVVGVVGVYARYWPLHDSRPRHGTAFIASGLIVHTVAMALGRIWWYAPVRTGALGYPSQVLEGVGIIVLLGGTLRLGAALWRNDTAPNWLGLLVFVAGAAVLVVVFGKYPLRVVWRFGTLTGYGVAGLVIGVHLWQTPSRGN